MGDHVSQVPGQGDLFRFGCVRIVGIRVRGFEIRILILTTRDLIQLPIDHLIGQAGEILLREPINQLIERDFPVLECLEIQHVIPLLS